MRTLERIGFLFILCCTVALLNRAGAQEALSGMSDAGAGGAVTNAPISTSRLDITAPDGRVVMRLESTPEGGGRIQLLNGKGKLVAALHSRADNNGEFALLDNQGVLRARFNGDPTGGSAKYYGRSGKQGLYVGTHGKRDAGRIAVWEGGRPRIDLSTRDQGGELAVYNGGGKRVFEAGAGDTGLGYVSTANAKGEVGLYLFAASHGGQVVVKNGRGKQAAFLGCAKNTSGGLLIVSAADGRRAVETGYNPTNDGGYLALNNANAKTAALLVGSGGPSGDTDFGSGFLQLFKANGKLGVSCRASRGNSFVNIYNSAGRAKQFR